QFVPERDRVGSKRPLLDESLRPAPPLRAAAHLRARDAAADVAFPPLKRGGELAGKRRPGRIPGALVERLEPAFLPGGVGRAERRGCREHEAGEERAHQLPLNRPGRFSKKAASASGWSSVLWQIAW